MAQPVHPVVRLHEGGVDHGRACSVRIDLAPDVVTLFGKACQQLMRQAPAGIVEVQDRNRCTECQTVGQDLLRADVLVGRIVRGKARVNTGVPAIAGPDFLHLEKLARGDAVVHVAQRAADPDCAILQALVDDAQDLVAGVEICLGFAPARLLAGFENGNRAAHQVVPAGPVDGDGTRKLVAYCTTVVGLRDTITRRVPFGYEGSGAAHLEVHGRGQPVAQSEPVAQRCLPVEMGVDEAGRNHVGGGVDGFRAAQVVLRDLDDPPVFNPDIGDVVVERLGVHDPTARDHEIVVLRNGRRRHGHGEKSCKRSCCIVSDHSYLWVEISKAPWPRTVLVQLTIGLRIATPAGMFWTTLSSTTT